MNDLTDRLRNRGTFMDEEAAAEIESLRLSLITSAGETQAALDRVAELETDALRYRHLKGDFSVSSPNIDGQHAWAYRRNFSLRGPTLDAAIDTAGT